MPYGRVFAINGTLVTPPTEWEWQNIVLGDALDGQQKESGYKMLTWTRRVGNQCHLDWYDYLGVDIDSLTTPSYGNTLYYETYDTDQQLLEVTSRQVTNTVVDITARFKVYVG